MFLDKMKAEEYINDERSSSKKIFVILLFLFPFLFSKSLFVESISFMTILIFFFLLVSLRNFHLNSIYKFFAKNPISFNSCEISKLKEFLNVKAYFIFKYPFHKYNQDIFIFLKYAVFICYLIKKDFKNAYLSVNELNIFINKYVIDNEELKEDDIQIELPTYFDEIINEKPLLYYCIDKKYKDDEYCIKLIDFLINKRCSLTKSELYDFGAFPKYIDDYLDRFKKQNKALNTL